MNIRRRVALIICVCFAVACALSCAYMTTQAGHDCAGELCAVCRIAAIVTQTMRLLTALIACAAVIAALALSARPLITARGGRGLAPLAVQGVRLNN